MMVLPIVFSQIFHFDKFPAVQYFTKKSIFKYQLKKLSLSSSLIFLINQLKPLTNEQ